MNHFGLSVEREARSDFTSTLDEAGIFTHALQTPWHEGMKVAWFHGYYRGHWHIFKPNLDERGGEGFFRFFFFSLRKPLIRRAVTCA